jgi:predicted nucleotidyltransferase
MDAAVRKWAERMALKQPGISRIGYFGSYARGDWGVGSDLDIVVVTDTPDTTISGADIAQLPVPADLLVYTTRQFDRLLSKGRFGSVLAEEVVWVYPRTDTSRRAAAPEGADRR